jgi:hypothetical protein
MARLKNYIKLSLDENQMYLTNHVSCGHLSSRETSLQKSKPETSLAQVVSTISVLIFGWVANKSVEHDSQ